MLVGREQEDICTSDCLYGLQIVEEEKQAWRSLKLSSNEENALTESEWKRWRE